MTIKERLVELITEAAAGMVPEGGTATVIPANGRSLAKIRSDSELDDDEFNVIVNFVGFTTKEKYRLDKGGEIAPDDQPADDLTFQVIVRPTDDETLDADGYELLEPLIAHLRGNAQHKDDAGRTWDIQVIAGTASTETAFANDVLDLTVICG